MTNPNKINPFGNKTHQQIINEIVQDLFDKDTLNRNQINLDLIQKTGKSLEDLSLHIARRVAEWSNSVHSVEEIHSGMLLMIIIHAIEDIMPMPENNPETEELDPVKTILLLMIPELVSGIAYPFLSLQSIRIKAVMLAQDSLVDLYLSLPDEHAHLLFDRYPLALDKAAGHVARALERKVAADNGYETEL